MGQKIFFIEEMQSDWSQRGRDAMPTPENVEKGTRLASAKDQQRTAVNFIGGEMDKAINQVRQLPDADKELIFDEMKITNSQAHHMFSPISNSESTIF